MASETFTLHRLGVIHAPWPDKFGVPRQAGLVDATSRLELDPAVLETNALRGLETASHLWIVFVFHRLAEARWRPTVRPPRLGGNARLGVLATRSPFRPNRLGLSAVRLLGVDGLTLLLGGGDFVDGTPVVDIKPYLPWADALPDARSGWSDAPPPRRNVRFSATALTQLDRHPRCDELRTLIRDTVALDPLPAYRCASSEIHGVRILDVDVRFSREGEDFVVVELVRAVPPRPREVS